MQFTRNPQFLRMAAVAAVLTPLPMPDITPPAIKMYLVTFCLYYDFNFFRNSLPVHFNAVFPRAFNRFLYAQVLLFNFLNSRFFGVAGFASPCGKRKFLAYPSFVSFVSPF